MEDDRNKWLGTLLIIGSAIAYSLSGYFTRLIMLDVWTVLFWRGIFGGLFIGTYVVWRYRKDLLVVIRAIGMAGFWVMVLSTVATICFINALRLAPVADVMTIHAALPFMTAILALVFTGEREDWATWAASFMALVGVMIIVNPQASGGHLAGYAFATTMALSYAAMMVIIRKNRQVSMLPAAGLSAFLCAFVVLPFAQPMQVTAPAMLDLVLFGTVQFGLGLLLMTVGTRLISATRSALIGSMENPLAPLWVWLAFGELPAWATWLGGGLVMGAVIFDVLTKSKRRQKSAEALAPD
ncbi:DMT family transporter [Rhizobium rhizogenes]|jgi:drug/metabolite transporter (DMT)-like permease|uniref:DMT family transporter n=1 Tax=Rhizobium rhizogenes TaxID=359 RepID=UPI000648C951|nr:DMT family transporter [Rhizobium rhizogenes]